MSDELESLGDIQLGEVFAREVLGWKYYLADGAWRWDDAEGCPVIDYPDFALSIGMVMPYLEQATHPLCERRDRMWTVFLFSMGDVPCGSAETFARAACLALIRAKRASLK